MEHVGTSAKKFPRLHGRRFLFNIGGTIDRGAEVAEVERRRRENRGRRGVWSVGGGSTGGGVWGGSSAPSQKIFRLRISKW